VLLCCGESQLRCAYSQLFTCLFSQRFRTSLSFTASFLSFAAPIFSTSPHLFATSLYLLSVRCFNIMISCSQCCRSVTLWYGSGSATRASALLSFAALHGTPSQLCHTSYQFAAPVNSELRRTIFKVRLAASQFAHSSSYFLWSPNPFGLLFTKLQAVFA
jgi:hypothetical protein